MLLKDIWVQLRLFLGEVDLDLLIINLINIHKRIPKLLFISGINTLLADIFFASNALLSVLAFSSAHNTSDSHQQSNNFAIRMLALRGTKRIVDGRLH